MDPKFVSEIHGILTRAGFRECRVTRKGRGKSRYASGYRGDKDYTDFKFYVTYDTPDCFSGTDQPDGVTFLGVSCERATVSTHKAYAKALNDAGIPTVTCGTGVYKSVRVWVAIPQLPESEDEGNPRDV